MISLWSLLNGSIKISFFNFSTNSSSSFCGVCSVEFMSDSWSQASPILQFRNLNNHRSIKTQVGLYLSPFTRRCTSFQLSMQHTFYCWAQSSFPQLNIFFVLILNHFKTHFTDQKLTNKGLECVWCTEF